MSAADVSKHPVEEVESIPPADPLKKHPLKQTWKYWYLNDRPIDWVDRLKGICTFNTVEDFWELYNNVKTPSNLNIICDYNVFKEGIRPMWEDLENAKGGRWLISVEKSRKEVTDIIWLEILIAMIGEQFGDDHNLICGIVVNVRPKGSKISVWTRDHTDDAGNLRIGEIIKRTLLTAEVPDRIQKPIFDVIRYQDHASCQHKNGPIVNAKLSITSIEPFQPASTH